MDWRFLSGFCWFTGPEVLGLPGGGRGQEQDGEGRKYQEEDREGRKYQERMVVFRGISYLLIST